MAYHTEIVQGKLSRKTLVLYMQYRSMKYQKFFIFQFFLELYGLKIAFTFAVLAVDASQSPT